MKFFISGLIINIEQDKVFALFIKCLEDILAKRDPNYINIIVLHEYALTKQAVEHQVVKQFVELLSNTLKDHTDVILLPGSFVSYKSYENEKYHKKTIDVLQKYNKLYQQKIMANDFEFTQERDRFFFELETAYFLKNSVYIITGMGKHKHKKYFPSDERSKAALSIRENSLFNIGTGGDIRKEISFGEKSLSVGILICREFYNHENNNQFLRNRNLLLEIIISDSICINPKDDLCGALTIHMDSKRKLSIFLNNSHPESKKIEEVQGVLYSITQDKINQETALVQAYAKDLNLKRYREREVTCA